MERQQALEEIGGFYPNAAQVGQARSPAFSIRLANPAQQSFDADEIMRGILPRVFDQERAIAAAQFDFERLLGGEQSGEIDPFQDGRQFVNQTRRLY